MKCFQYLAALLLLFLTSCQTMQNTSRELASHFKALDQSYLNHSVLDLSSDLVPSASPQISNLGSVGAVSGGGACTVCAH